MAINVDKVSNWQKGSSVKKIIIKSNYLYLIQGVKLANLVKSDFVLVFDE